VARDHTVRVVIADRNGRKHLKSEPEGYRPDKVRFTTLGPRVASQAPRGARVAEAPTTDGYTAMVCFGDPPAKPLLCAKSELQDTLLDGDSGRKLYLRCLPDERERLTRLYPILAVVAVPLVAYVSANDVAAGEHTNVFVNCFCSDVVGGELCTTLKEKVGAYPATDSLIDLSGPV
jgi:hypothetical protein